MAATSASDTTPFLVAANLVPLGGVLLFAWDLQTILALYWIENGIVGALNVPKILLAKGPLSVHVPGGALQLASPDALRFVLAPFFLVHYGLFWAAHGLFVLGIPSLAAHLAPGSGFAPGFTVAEPEALVVGATSLGVGHLASFRANFLGRREYLRITAIEQMIRPYGRVVVLHMTIVVGALLVALAGAPIGLLAVLVLAKTGFDLRQHLRDHRKAQAGGATSPADWLRT